MSVHGGLDEVKNNRKLKNFIGSTFIIFLQRNDAMRNGVIYGKGYGDGKEKIINK
jgi:hypothetical protein